MKVALGGERVGSGNKMNLHLRNYERSTHNLSRSFKSSMGVGILTPCYCNVALRGDKFDFKLSAGARTIPSKGALFGSYKLQVDYYLCPVRLYTGILHNNPVNIGLNMKNVYFPNMTQGYYYTDTNTNKVKPIGFAKNSLLHYLGLSGLGNLKQGIAGERTFNAIPVLAYYDIFKNYYSNKQEEAAYAIGTESIIKEYGYEINGATQDTDTMEIYNAVDERPYNRFNKCVTFEFDGATDTDIELSGNGRINPDNIYYKAIVDNDGRPGETGILSIKDNMPTPWGQVQYSLNPDPEQQDFITINYKNTNEDLSGRITIYFKDEVKNTYDYKIKLNAFGLSNIDEMRAALLSHHTMGTPLNINSQNITPYQFVAPENEGTDWVDQPNMLPLNGLVLKTYQSDMFNNWLSSEYIDGVNGIANITKVSTEGGGFTIDSLNYAEKMYYLLNRVLVKGNTYEDWQDVVYENTPKRHLESPMYIGGISQEIVFEEIVSTAVTEGAGLGQMGGRGISRHRKGGHIRVKVDEASFIIGIASITPRLNYGQGNSFYFTDIKTADDFHKPALDGIGFQDLIGERMAYFDTIVNAGKNNVTRHSIGKLPAWIEYMTDVDRVHGDFADEDNENSFMVLNRNYEFDELHRCIKDATTYVEPEKYNSAFLYTALDSQNFWVQIQHDIIARRKMSAKQIPNI